MTGTWIGGGAGSARAGPVPTTAAHTAPPSRTVAGRRMNERYGAAGLLDVPMGYLIPGKEDLWNRFVARAPSG
ncbi:Uncharacterised protein [Mycobacteroides abscessus subsp. abscessus]|nr:Uncharacterised protein [Mycobacteroides abscessus subsp. abscessus]